MLIIYGALVMGGIETFIVRISKARFLEGKNTKILLVANKNKNNTELLEEVKKYSEVYFLEDFYLCNIFKYFPIHLLLIKVLNYNKISMLFNGISQVHTSNSIYGLFYKKIDDKLKLKIPLTVGIYHAKEFTWKIKKIPYFEKVNRQLFRKILLANRVVFFNELLPRIYSKFYEFSSDNLNIFPLGVIEKQDNVIVNKNKNNNILKIVSVGRLVKFKSYNLYMIDVINKLKNIHNIQVEYHIYGTGILIDEMLEKINKYGLESNIYLKGELEYSKFSTVVKEFDLFIGSGTAIVEAASLGLPSIIGIEINLEPMTYGYLSNINGFTYNEDELYEKVSVEKLILDFLRLDDKELKKLELSHIKWSDKFLMKKCVENFENIKGLKNYYLEGNSELIKINYVRYSLSFLFLDIYCRIKGTKISEIIYS